jgi:hypothetical protein
VHSTPSHKATQGIQGTDHLFEARVDRSYRLSFQFEGQDILLRNVDNHDECLRQP